MNPSPPHPDPPDEITALYRRLSEADPSRPGKHLYDAIRAQAAHGAGELRAAAAAQRAGGQSSFRGARRWQWRAAAGIAAAGLVGLISWQQLRTVPPAASPGDSAHPVANSTEWPGPGSVATTHTESTATQALAPSLAPVPSRPREFGAAAPGARVANTAGRQRATTGAAFSSDGALPRAQASQATAGAQVAGATPQPSASVPRAADSSPHQALVIDRPVRSSERALVAGGAHEQVLRAARASYPELFAADSPYSTAVVTIVLNHDGSVYKSRRDLTPVRAEIDAGTQIAATLGINSIDLDSSGVFEVPAQSGNGTGRIQMIYGVMK